MKKKHAGGRPPLPPEERRAPLTVRLPSPVIEGVKLLAEERDVSVGHLVEAALRECYDL